MSIPDKPSQAEGEDTELPPQSEKSGEFQADPEDKPSQAEGE